MALPVNLFRHRQLRLVVEAEEVDDAALTDKRVAVGASLIPAPTETPWRSLNSRLEGPAGLQPTPFEELEAAG